MAHRSWIFAGVFSAAFALNPGYLVGCAPERDDAKFSYDEHDMAAVVAALDAAGALSYERDGARYVVHVTMDALAGRAARRTSPATPAFASVAHACGTRQFMFASPASACIDASELTFSAVLNVARTDRVVYAADAPVQGTLWVPSLHLTGGEITLGTDDVRVQISAREGDDGFTFEVTNITL